MSNFPLGLEAVPHRQLVDKRLQLVMLMEGLLEVMFLEFRFHNIQEWVLPNSVGDQRLHRVV